LASVRTSAAARLYLAIVLGLAGCGPTSETPRAANPEAHLPEIWRRATVDPRNGGRFLREAREALRAFQAGVTRAGAPVLYPHYAGARTVVLGVKADFVPLRIRRRIEELLDHEGSGSDLRILALTDAPVEEVASALGRAGRDPRISFARVSEASAPATFPFVRDFAPLVLARPVAEDYATSGLVLFGGSNLNQVLDRELEVYRFRRLDALRDRLAVSRRVLSIYRERLAATAPRRTGELVPFAELTTALDGGNLLGDGRGTCFMTGIVLDKNRRNAERVRADLRDRAGCARSVFLRAPQRLDPVQHVDTLLFFADEENAVLSMPTLYESDLAHDAANTRTLLELGYTVHRVPRRTASLSYANILVTQRNVYVPQYSRYLVESPQQLARRHRIAGLDRQRDRETVRALLQKPDEPEPVDGDPQLELDNRRAVEVLERLMPNHEIVALNSDETLGSLGSWHCLSHELPEAL
jgi:hypothetical protein